MQLSEAATYAILDKAKKYDELIILNSNKILSCSFCGKSQNEVKRLIAGSGVYICNECIELCSEILEEEDASQSDKSE